MLGRVILFVTFGTCIGFLAGCRPKATAVDAWYVVGRHGDRWSIIKTEHAISRQIRYAITCDWSRQGNTQIHGGCDLAVGTVLVQNGLPEDPADFVDIWISGDRLSVTRGDGEQQTSEGFTIQSAETERIDPQLPQAKHPRTLAGAQGR
jgi:hypothetical protein